MSDIDETISRYQSVCQEEGIDVNPYFEQIFTYEMKDAQAHRNDTMSLYLAGNNTLLKTQYRLSDRDCVLLYKWLRNNLYVVSLDLRYNNIGDDGAKHVAKLVEETACLKELNLMCNDFGKEGAQHLAKALHKNETLTVLKLTGNKFGDAGGMAFAQALQINMTLESLDLSDTDLKTDSVIALATVLHNNTTIKALNVGRPLLFTQQEEPTVHFSKMLKVNKTLQELHMEKYDMRDFGVTRLAECLHDNFNLTYLNLSCNRITRDGAKELSALLKRDTPLKVLDLGYNRLGDDGARHIAEAVATYNTTLTTLVLRSNEVCGQGLCAVADCMKMNTTLSNVYIWGNKLEESACIAFAGLLDTGRLEPQNTDVEAYMVDGVTYLSELPHGVRRWYLWGPSYGDQAQPELKKFIQKPGVKAN